MGYNTIKEIYKHEVFCVAKSGCYCGMWQFYQAANVISQPVKSIYPLGYLTPQYRMDMNRTVNPICLHETS